jgi:hypothetical protein
MAAFVALAKGDLPTEAWLHLGRTHTLHKRQPILLSWSGTMFEYLMPALWMRSYPDTVLEQSIRVVVGSQQEYARIYKVPWGISEAAYSRRDKLGFYQYKAFGLPFLALKPEESRDLVVSPYSTSLALNVEPDDAIRNFRRMETLGWLGKFGMYESAEYGRTRVRSESSHEVMKCWMAHHQGMTLLALCNSLTNCSIQRSFHQEPLVAANERILHEKLPLNVSIDSQFERGFQIGSYLTNHHRTFGMSTDFQSVFSRKISRILIGGVPKKTSDPIKEGYPLP